MLILKINFMTDICLKRGLTCAVFTDFIYGFRKRQYFFGRCSVLGIEDILVSSDISQKLTECNEF